ncbi:MAG: TrkH family potassium uptake protein [Nitratireductor sp.]|nr:TrkH family potassium uptake protein [Nitratireductor sp.]
MLQAISLTIAILGCLMIFPALADFMAGNPDWIVFTVSASVNLFVGGAIWLAMRRHDPDMDRREIFIFVPTVWLLSSLASAMPFYLSGLDVSFTDAMFESVSGLTTTGSTVLSNLDSLPPGILLWRSLTQWIGGLGVVVMGMVLLPSMRSGGQQLFQLESSDKGEKPFARSHVFTERIAILYLAVTTLCAITYLLLGMDPFDAFNHAMTTVSTGGFSTSDLSMGLYGTTGMLLASTFFMAVGGLPFIFLIRLSAGRFEWDIQITYYLVIVLSAALLVLINMPEGAFDTPAHRVATALFNVTSIITTTGYASQDYLMWGPAAIAIFFFLTFAGGCAGSTAGGFKQFRFVVIHQIIVNRLRQTIRPHQMEQMKYGQRLLDPQIASSVVTFSFLYTGTFIVFALIYGLLGLEFDTAISASATALANVGPGITEAIGPAGNFAGLSDAIKQMLCFEMIVGRLEIMSVYVMLVPGFWR